MKTKILDISQIKIEKEMYPRMNIDWVTTSRYYNALRSGAQFPPIVVAELNNNYYLVDGAHRLKAYKDIWETHILAEVLSGLDAKQIYIEAVKRNITHGRQFSTQEVTNVCITLDNWNLSNEEISEIIRLPANEIKPFVAKRMMRVTGMMENGEEQQETDIALKSPLKNLAGAGSSIPNQKKVGGQSQLSILDTLIVLFKNGWINDNPIVREKLLKIKELIEEYITD